MSATLQQTLERLSEKAGRLAEANVRLRSEKSEALARVAELESQLTHAQQEIRRMQTEIEMLSVVTVISPSREKVERTRLFISKLVQEVDKCIAELSD